ncbi:hypothetical protein NCS57_00514900 [Fusarium keratoplasticum]|uniref:Uncharacterized protein n=1 Tax=Fusarium keratoplasticum TaxID=1328300 RepID=A0ACC0QZF3_9HYPO|nr:hypothetical protein NCS57_00514900 [Fusarium keratoplasticum]KAI8670437.1 hypothetical protein NCS57_00514900 [Fusarium keratoplasticum]
MRRFISFDDEANPASGSGNRANESPESTMSTPDPFLMIERALENYNVFKSSTEQLAAPLERGAELFGEEPNSSTSNSTSAPRDILATKTTQECVIYVHRLADPQTFARYENISVRSVISEASDIFECTAGCGNAQYHTSGSAHPIVICDNCGARSCFNHRVKWHERLTCDEYNEYLQDPLNFKSRLEIEEEEARRQKERQEQEDFMLAQGITDTERAQQQAERESRKRESREAERQAKRQAAMLKMQQEEASLATVGRISKPCPGCRRPIQKNEGCQHMTCSQCRYQFCWSCNALWSNGHSINCTRLPR